MPIFDFKCNTCGNIFEDLVKDADSKASCPECESKDCQRQLGSFSIRFHGKGFHNTDYKQSSKPAG
jgi:putative FmdB family regulatory protein